MVLADLSTAQRMAKTHTDRLIASYVLQRALPQHTPCTTHIVLQILYDKHVLAAGPSKAPQDSSELRQCDYPPRLSFAVRVPYDPCVLNNLDAE